MLWYAIPMLCFETSMLCYDIVMLYYATVYVEKEMREPIVYYIYFFEWFNALY